MQFWGSVNAYGSFTGINFVDSNSPSGANILTPLTINSYSVLTIPAYWRAMIFKTQNMTSFPRTIRQDRTKLATPHPLDRLLCRRPNNYQSAWKFWSTLFFHYAHWHNGFARIKRTIDGAGIDSLHNLNPDFVVPFRFSPDGDPLNLQQWYLLRPEGIILPAEDVIHFGGLSFDGMQALNPTWLHRLTYERALGQGQYMTRLITTGGVIRGTINFPAGTTQEQVDEAMAIIGKHYSGAGGDRSLLPLVGATLSNDTITPVDAQMDSQVRLTTKQISQITGVPEHFLMDDADAKYNNSIAQTGEEVVRYCFRPDIEQSEAELNLKLLRDDEVGQGLGVYIDPDALIRGDRAGQAELVSQLRTAAVITANEGRGELGYGPSKDPAASKLSNPNTTAGEAPGQPPIEKQAEAQTMSADPPKAEESPAAITGKLIFEALKPLIGEACAGVDRITAAALETPPTDPGERITWSDDVVRRGTAHAAKVVGPIVDVLNRTAGMHFDTNGIANAYGRTILESTRGLTPVPLSEIVYGWETQLRGPDGRWIREGSSGGTAKAKPKTKAKAKRKQVPPTTPGAEESEPRPANPSRAAKPVKNPRYITLDPKDSTPDHVAAVKEGLGKIPAKLRKRLQSAGLKVELGSDTLTHHPHLAGQRPRGYAEHLDYRHVEAFRQSAPGGGPGSIHVFDTVLDETNTRVQGKRGVSAALHEFGHSADEHLAAGTYLNRGAKLSQDPSFVAAHQADVGNLSPTKRLELDYYVQPGDTTGKAGASEAFAEAFAAIHGENTGRADFADHFPRTVAAVKAALKEHAGVSYPRR